MLLLELQLGNLQKKQTEAFDWTSAWSKFGLKDTEEGWMCQIQKPVLVEGCNYS